MDENKHVVLIPEHVLGMARANIELSLQQLQPYLIGLTPAERHDLPKMGDKTLSFVEKAYEYAEAYPSFRPSYINMEEFLIDITDATRLRVLRNIALQLFEEVDDTEMIAGSEAFQAALGFYNNVKLLAARDVPGAKAVYDELKKRFRRPSRRSSKNENEND
jgi:hypothetical protein